MLTVGFEPTRVNTEHLKCSPLDQLGHVSDSNILGTRQFSIGTNPRFRVLQQGSNLHPVINSDCWICCKFPLLLCSFKVNKYNLFGSCCMNTLFLALIS